MLGVVTLDTTTPVKVAITVSECTVSVSTARCHGALKDNLFQWISQTPWSHSIKYSLDLGW